MRIGVVGAGYWGPNLMRNIAADPQAELAWVCDIDRDRALSAARRHPGVAVTDRVDDLLEDDDLVGVALATPAHTHAALALRFLDAGKHLLIEKPLAASVAEGRAIVEKADSLGLVVMCDHTFCFTPAVQRIRDLVRGGTIGEVQFVDSVRINLGLVQNDIDVLWDLAPHDLSILDFVLPEEQRPLSVAAHGADPIGAGRLCVGYLTLALPGQAIAHLHANWLSPTKVRTTIIGGSRRTIVWDDLNPAQRISVFDRGVDLAVESDREAVRRTLVSYRSGDMVAPALPETEALAGAVSEFLAAIEEQRRPVTDGQAGLRVLEILEAADRSIASGGLAVAL